MFTHEIKLCDPHYKFLRSGIRNFHICLDDKMFKVGEIMRILEFRWKKNHNIRELTGEHFDREISNILRKAPGLMSSYVIVSMKGES